MTEKVRDYSETLFLPQTSFPMRAGLPQKEPEMLARWQRLDLYRRLREAARGRAKFILHDGPPYANGNIHLGTALNKILKDVVTRSQQMLGFDSNYVPGWDCHGLPIEWKIEEEYRAKGRNKDAVPINEFRAECRAFAAHWIDVQREEFKRLGVEGDWAHPYSTMEFAAEAQIARELMKFVANGTLYRGSKPVMWSVVEKTALAVAEVEYEDYTSDTVWVKFPINRVAAVTLANHTARDSNVPENEQLADLQTRTQMLFDDLRKANIVIWTTTPWTIPGNRAISFSRRIEYALFEVEEAPPDNWAKIGERFLLAEKLVEDVFRHARVTKCKKLHKISATVLPGIICLHPLRDWAKKNGLWPIAEDLGAEAAQGLDSDLPYNFQVPLFDGDHVTEDAGTGFVHTAPGHGREDHDIWTKNARTLAEGGISRAIPYTVDGDGAFTAQAPGFTGKRVITDKGEKGDANEAVIKALADAGMLIARGRLKHQYPHSWRSKKPVIFRNTPQWFIAMDKDIVDDAGGARQGDTLRNRALTAINETRWVPESGKNRLTGMVETRPDW